MSINNDYKFDSSCFDETFYDLNIYLVFYHLPLLHTLQHVYKLLYKRTVETVVALWQRDG